MKKWKDLSDEERAALVDCYQRRHVEAVEQAVEQMRELSKILRVIVDPAGKLGFGLIAAKLADFKAAKEGD